MGNSCRSKKVTICQPRRTPLRDVKYKNDEKIENIVKSSGTTLADTHHKLALPVKRQPKMREKVLPVLPCFHVEHLGSAFPNKPTRRTQKIQTHAFLCIYTRQCLEI
jgi:hypothetical protein